MTIGSVNRNGGNFDAWSTEGAAFSPTSVSAELAVLMLETNEQQKNVDRDQLALARADYADAVQNEVHELKSAADAKLRGAALQSVLTVVSAGVGFAGVGKGDDSYAMVTSKLLGNLAEPLGAAASHTYADANAAGARGEQKAAEWRIDDARTNLKEEDGLQSKALDWLSSLLDQDAATMNAILSNKV